MDVSRTVREEGASKYPLYGTTVAEPRDNKRVATCKESPHVDLKDVWDAVWVAVCVTS